MHQYAIGLDIGVTSVGWATLALDESESPCGILNMGSRIFAAAEHPKTGASLALPRREARSARRRLRRHRHRNERIRQLFVNSGLITEEELSSLFDGKGLPDIYELRVRALDEPVTSTEMARILLHISQRRGFRSNRKGAQAKEDGKLLEAVSENKKRMDEHGYRTVGEMFFKDEAFSAHKRNKGGNYSTTVTRDMVEDEVHAIFSAQRGFGAKFADKNFENTYTEILLSQRSFDDGPACGPYSGSQIERMIGRCVFEPDEPRSAKGAYSFEVFTLLEKLNHIRLISGGSSEPLSESQRKRIFELAHEKENLTYAVIRKELGLPENITFNMVKYPDNESIEDTEKKEKTGFLKSYHMLRKALDKNGKNRITFITIPQRNEIARILSTYKTSEKIRPRLEELGLEKCDVDIIEGLNYSKFGHLSVKACDKIIPYLEQGMTYNEACQAAGYDFRAHSGNEKSKLLPPISDDCNEITSPVVRRTISQTIKVVNAIIRKYGESPVYINIELARELANNFSERQKIKRTMDENRAKNERVMEQIAEYKHGAPTGLDLVKLKLFEEQGGVCAYSLRQMSIERLFEPNYAEVDHIVPYSISFDDGYKNKVLVLTEENRNKGNRLPMQYLTGKRKDDFQVWVNSCIRDSRKRRLLLKESFTEEDEKNFKERALQDTKTAAVFMLNYINDNLLFAPSLKGRKKRVTAVNGAVTAYMRKRWGITKIREDGDLHHAVDAVVIACTTDGMIQKVSRYSSWRERHYMRTENGSILIDPATGEIKQEFPYPWEHFRKELEARTANDPSRVIAALKLPFYMDDDAPRVHPLFVSRMPTRKVTGAAHKDTVKSAKAKDEGYAIVKRPLSALKLDKDGEIDGYYKPESDRLLYEALKKQLAEYGGDGTKAFKEPFYKPKRNGAPGNEVSKVKLLEPITLSVDVQGKTGIADNDSMVRIDIFKVEGDGYYFVPIYVADTLKDKLPNKACVAFKPYEQWKEMSDSDFVFSVYPNDLLKISHKRALKLTKTFKESTLPPALECKEILMYYRGAGINTAAISCFTHDNTYKIDSLGIKTLASIEKYEVDVLGEYHPVRQEVRQRFGRKGE